MSRVVRLTPTQVELLRAVDRGEVRRVYGFGWEAYRDQLDRGQDWSGTGLRFVARDESMGTLLWLGLVELLPSSQRYAALRLWALTADGVASLEAVTP